MGFDSPSHSPASAAAGQRAAAGPPCCFTYRLNKSSAGVTNGKSERLAPQASILLLHPNLQPRFYTARDFWGGHAHLRAPAAYRGAGALRAGGGAWGSAADRRALCLGAWPGMNTLIDKNAELLHSKEDLLLLLVYLCWRENNIFDALKLVSREYLRAAAAQINILSCCINPNQNGAQRAGGFPGLGELTKSRVSRSRAGLGDGASGSRVPAGHRKFTVEQN